MELTGKSSLLRTGSSGSRGRGNLVPFGLAALAAVLVVVAFSSGKSKNGSSSAPAAAAPQALVASQAVQKGSSIESAVLAHLVAPATVGQLREGAITDVSAVTGQVAKRDILPGEQLTAADFAAADNSLGAQLAKDQRAVAVPLDAAHGLQGDIGTGDHVDILAAFDGGTGNTSQSVVRVLARNVLVLKGPDLTDKSDSKGVITVRVTDKTAAKVALTADAGKVWLTLRPPTGAVDTAPSNVTVPAILSGAASPATSTTTSKKKGAGR